MSSWNRLLPTWLRDFRNQRRSRLHCLERQINRQKSKRLSVADAARKADTYRKITLGGLVIKAGLGELDRAVLLGLLMESAALLQHPETVPRQRAQP